MAENPKTFDIDELCGLVGLSRRTVRYYIQLGLVNPPEGETRAARYSQTHLDRLLTIRNWSEAGLSLDAIRELVEEQQRPPMPVPRRRPGSVEVWSHLLLAEGVELMLEPSRAGLTPGQVRELVRRCIAAFDEVRKEKHK